MIKLLLSLFIWISVSFATPFLDFKSLTSDLSMAMPCNGHDIKQAYTQDDNGMPYYDYPSTETLLSGATEILIDGVKHEARRCVTHTGEVILEYTPVIGAVKLSRDEIIAYQEGRQGLVWTTAGIL